MYNYYYEPSLPRKQKPYKLKLKQMCKGQFLPNLQAVDQRVCLLKTLPSSHLYRYFMESAGNTLRISLNYHNNMLKILKIQSTLLKR